MDCFFRSFFYTIFFIFIISCSNNTQTPDPPKAKNGVLDLRHWDFDKDGIISLEGYWKLEKGKYLDSNFLTKEYSETINIPGSWNHKITDIEDNKGKNHALFYLRILTNKANQILSIKTASISSAYKLYINGELIEKNGYMGNKAIGKLDTNISTFLSDTKEIDIVYVVTDNLTGDIGIWDNIYLGNSSQIIERADSKKRSEFFLIGAMMIMFTYHLGLFLVRKKDLSSLIFAIFAFILALRVLVTGERSINSILMNPSWNILFRIEFLTFYFGPPLFHHFFLYLYPNEFSKKVNIALYGLTIIFSATVLLLPAPIYRFLSIYYQYIALVAILIVFWGLIKIVIKKRQGGKLLFASTLIFLLTLSNDIFNKMNITDIGYLWHYGFLTLIFSQAYILSKRFSLSFIKIEELSQTLININKANQKFVPAEFLDLLQSKDITQIKLGDKVEKEMSILFADIRDFTNLSESMTADDNFRFINSYLKRMGPVIRENNGFIDKYIGDSIMALFPDDVESSIDSSLKIHEKLEKYNADRLKCHYKSIKVGIGIHYGNLMLGTIGETERMEGTVISDSVNLASRLEGLTKIYGCSVIVSEKTLKKVSDPDKYQHRQLDTIRVKGKNELISIYQIFTKKELEVLSNSNILITNYEKGLEYYRLKQFSNATDILNKVLKIYPSDTPTKILLNKINILKNQDLDENWDAITTMMEK